MGSKNKNQRKGRSGGGAAADEGKQMITDPRFSSAHTDPRFRRVPRRESKVTIDSRFQSVFTDKASAPVDKRGKRIKGRTSKDSLKEFYRIDDEEEEDKKEDKVDSDDDENELLDLKSKESSKQETKREKKLGFKLASLDEDSDESEEPVESEESEEDDTDEDDEAIYVDDGPDIPEENITNIEKETHRLAIVRMDWRHVSAKDLYVVLNSFLPKGGRILSVAVYPTEFGLQRMKEEEIHGPAIDSGKKKLDDDDDDDDEEEEEEDEDVINQKLRDYEISRLKYYHAVAECDSSATADSLYKSCDGLEFERSSNKLDLRFIPDSMEFKHPPRDIATETPSVYEGLDFHSRALQLSKVNLSWDEDEPHRVKTLNQKFNPDQLAELELKEFLASDESESDDESKEGNILSKKEKYRSLFESEDVDSDKDNEKEENDQDMEVTFNTGLEDLSRQILEKKDQKSESVWETYLRQRREKKRARKNKQKEDDDDDDDYNVSRKVVKDDGDDDFFMEEEPPLKKKKKEEGKKKKGGLEEEEEERRRAELELLLADENAGEGNGVKGYNIKRKGKKGSKEIAEEKIPEADLDDPRFSSLILSPNFALDPTDPHFKRSATYARQLAHKQKEDPRKNSYKEVKATNKAKAEIGEDSKKEGHELNSVVKSLKMKIKGNKPGNVESSSSSSLAQRIKKKAIAFSSN